MVAINTDLASARSRVIAALQELNTHVNRPALEPSNRELFEQLSEEFRMASDAYRAMVSSLMNEESERSNAAD